MNLYSQKTLFTKTFAPKVGKKLSSPKCSQCLECKHCWDKKRQTSQAFFLTSYLSLFTRKQTWHPLTCVTAWLLWSLLRCQRCLKQKEIGQYKSSRFTMSIYSTCKAWICTSLHRPLKNLFENESSSHFVIWMLPSIGKTHFRRRRRQISGTNLSHIWLVS